MGTTGATFVRFGFGAPFALVFVAAIHLAQFVEYVALARLNIAYTVAVGVFLSRAHRRLRGIDGQH